MPYYQIALARLAASVACTVPLAVGAVAARAERAATDPVSVGVSAAFYFPEDDEDYVQPTAYADRGALHVEARFNYEDRDTGSAWLGWNLAAGERLSLEVTPMLGIVFGQTQGIAPGYKASLGWRNVELYSEGEYVFDADDSDDSFFYTWTELTAASSTGWRAGLVVQRTKAYQTGFDIQRGLLGGIDFERLSVTGYVLNPDESPIFVLAFAGGF